MKLIPGSQYRTGHARMLGVLALAVVAGAPSIALALRTCYCSKLGSACTLAQPVLPAGHDCWVERPGSDTINNAIPDTEKGQISFLGGSVSGNCKYRTGVKGANGWCDYVAPTITISVQSTNPDLGPCYFPCNVPE